jgi:hypothetical protein
MEEHGVLMEAFGTERDQTRIGWKNLHTVPEY